MSAHERDERRAAGSRQIRRLFLRQQQDVSGGGYCTDVEQFLRLAGETHFFCSITRLPRQIPCRLTAKHTGSTVDSVRDPLHLLLPCCT